MADYRLIISVSSLTAASTPIGDMAEAHLHDLQISISALTAAAEIAGAKTWHLSLSVSAKTIAAPDMEIWSPCNPSIRLPWEKYAGEIDMAVQSPWSQLTILDARNAASWSAWWREILFIDVGVAAPWSSAEMTDVENILPMGGSILSDIGVSLIWPTTDLSDVGVLAPWARMLSADPGIRLPWDRVSCCDFETELPWQVTEAVDLEIRLAWAKMAAVDAGIETPWSRTIPLDVVNFSPYERQYIKQALKKAVSLPWMAAARIIMSKQNVTFKRVSDDASIGLLPGVSVDQDDGSWCWKMTGTLPSKADADLLRPDPLTGDMVEVELSVNGQVFRFLVSSVQENYVWAKGTYNITGYSPTWLLGDPAPRITKTWGAQPAQTVVSGLLSDSAYTYTWNLLTATWNLMNGDLSVTDAQPIDVIKQVAAAPGGIVQTAPSGYELILQSRYPISPKDWASSTPAQSLLSGVMSQGVDPRPQPGYNSIVVSGKNSGVIATIVRSGTAGDNSAPAVVDPLLTAAALVVERGRVELDDTGYNKANETLLLPMPGPGNYPDLLLPGDLVAVQDLTESWRGQVRGTSISVDYAKTRQRLSVERAYL